MAQRKSNGFHITELPTILSRIEFLIRVLHQDNGPVGSIVTDPCFQLLKLALGDSQIAFDEKMLSLAPIRYHIVNTVDFDWRVLGATYWGLGNKAHQDQKRYQTRRQKL